MSKFTIDWEELHQLCKIGQRELSCQYGVVAPTGFECAKHQPKLRQQIEARVTAGTYVARGDNCPGKGSPDA